MGKWVNIVAESDFLTSLSTSEYGEKINNHIIEQDKKRTKGELLMHSHYLNSSNADATQQPKINNCNRIDKGGH